MKRMNVIIRGSICGGPMHLPAIYNRTEGSDGNHQADHPRCFIPDGEKDARQMKKLPFAA
jgi:hypothetical protein